MLPASIFYLHTAHLEMGSTFLEYLEFATKNLSMAMTETCNHNINLLNLTDPQQVSPLS